MKDINNKEIIDFLKKWAGFFIIFLVIILVLAKIGTCIIHEPGHYLVGKIYDCSDLQIKCPAFFGKEISNYVEGWESCPNQIVIGEQGERICNTGTYLANLGGFFLSLITIIPLFLAINSYLKRKIKKYYFEGKLFILIIFTIIIWLFKSSAIDLFKIAECLINHEFANRLLNLLWVIPDIFIYLVLIIFIVDVYLMLLKEKVIVFNR